MATYPSHIYRYRLSLIREPETTYRPSERCTAAGRTARLLHDVLENAPQEVMGALYLDSRQAVLGYHLAYRGTLTRTTVEPRGLLVPGLLVNAAGLIAFHNHPSGDASPSREDLSFTARLREAGDVVGVPVLDHLILGEAPTYTSLRRSESW